MLLFEAIEPTSVATQSLTTTTHVFQITTHQRYSPASLSLSLFVDVNRSKEVENESKRHATRRSVKPSLTPYTTSRRADTNSQTHLPSRRPGQRCQARMHITNRANLHSSDPSRLGRRHRTWRRADRRRKQPQRRHRAFTRGNSSLSNRTNKRHNNSNHTQEAPAPTGQVIHRCPLVQHRVITSHNNNNHCSSSSSSTSRDTASARTTPTWAIRRPGPIPSRQAFSMYRPCIHASHIT